LPRITGAPSSEDQITALTWQDNWFSLKRHDEEQAASIEHARKIYRQEQERRGVKFCGRDAEAREAAAHLLETDPAFTISACIARGGQSNSKLQIEGLRKAGLPE
jgi:hypothetical protein